MRRFTIALAVLFGFSIASPAGALTYTWVGNNSIKNWNMNATALSSANWTSTATDPYSQPGYNDSPQYSGIHNLIFTGTAGLQNTTSRLTISLNYEDITFDSAAGAFVISAPTGTAYNLNLYGDIINNSTSLQTINLSGLAAQPIVLQTTGSPHTVNAAAGNIAIGAVISGTGGLTKTGDYMLTLSGANTYGGGTTVSAGTLLFTNAAAKPSTGTVTVAPAGTLGLGVGGAGYFTSANLDALFAGTLSGVTLDEASGVALDATAGNFAYANDIPSTVLTTLGLTKLGANTLTLSGANAYTGPTTISAGALATQGSGLSGDSYLRLDGGVYETSGTFTRVNSTTAAGTNFQWMSANGGGFSANGGKLTVTINNDAATEQVWGTAAADNGIWGTLKFGSTTASAETEFQNKIDLGNATRTINVAAGAGNDFATISGDIRNSSGTGNLIKTGAGRLVLSGANTYNGTTTINAGALQFNSTGAIGGTGRTVTVNSGGAVMFGTSFGDGNIPTALSGRIAAASAGVIAADNYADKDFNFSTAGLTAASLGAVGDVTYTGTFTPNGTAYRLGGGGGTLTMSNTNALTGTNKTLTVIGPGTVVLAAANSYTGTTTLNGGVLALTSSGTMGGNTITFAGGVLAKTDNSTHSFSNLLSTTVNAYRFGGSGRFNFTNSMAFNGSGAITVDGSAVVQGSVTFSGNTGYMGLTKQGTGILVMVGDNAYGGRATATEYGTMVSGGALFLNGTLSRNNGGTGGAGGQITVSSGATFGGTGTIKAGSISAPSLVVQSGGFLSPGDRTLLSPEADTLTAQNSVILQANSTTSIRLFGDTICDRLVQSTLGTLTFGGTLSVTKEGSWDFANNQTWNLFDWDSKSGTFALLDLPVLPSGSWDTTNLYINGTISIKDMTPPSKQWSLTAASDAWEDPDNWNGGLAAGSNSGITNGDTAQFSNASSTLSISPDAGRNLKSITFDTADAGAYTIGVTDGNALHLTAGGTIQTTSTVVNPQTVNAPLVLEGADATYTFSSNAELAANTLTLGGDIGGGAAGATVLALGGSNSGDNTLGGDLADNSATSLSLQKVDEGKWVVSGVNNTYSGPTQVLAGTLEFKSLADAGEASSLGAPTGAGSTIALSSLGHEATLRFTGSAASTSNRVIELDMDGILDASGTGLFTLDNGESASILGKGNVLTLTGTGSGQINSPISNIESLTKTDDGTWTLGGANDYEGGTTVTGGTLVIASATALPSGRNLSIGAGGTVVLGGLNLVNGVAAPIATVPEPGTLALLTAAALAALGAAARRRQKVG